MLDPEKVKVARDWITSHWQSGQFKQIFVMVPRSGMSAELGIKYQRFLDLIKHPGAFRYSEIVTMGKKLDVPARFLSQLIHNQLEAPKSAGNKNK
jgi:hypothetical protein